jgi:3-phenylpropionate/cinnamic acid dioxygenase small subunit
MSNADTLFRLSALNAAYASCIDADRLEEWPELFLETCVYKVTTADNLSKGYAAGLIFADSRKMLIDRVTSLRKANIYERQRYRHVIGMPVIQSGIGDEANLDIQAETSFVIVRTMRDGKMDLFAAGLYLDRVRPDANGALRFAERIAVCDSSRFDTLVAIPL